LVLKELALTMPTYFYQHVSQFFDLIFLAIQDIKPAIRESAVEAFESSLSGHCTEGDCQTEPEATMVIKLMLFLLKYIFSS
jgi:hypothetical protein